MSLETRICMNAGVNDPHPYSLAEEIVNSITHGIGAGLSVAGLVLILFAAVTHGGTATLLSALVFGVTMVLLYSSSMLYHAILRPRAKRIFHIIDHSSIYLLIAGTYTPFALLVLHRWQGWSLLAIVWTIAGVGIVAESRTVDKPKIISAVIYLAMGWLVVIVLKPLAASLPTQGLLWLAAGGFFYTAGVAFYIEKRIPFMHAVWHLFVLSGTTCHYFAVWRYVIPG